MSESFDLRQYVPGLPSGGITKEYLQGLTPDGAAKLLRDMDKGVESLRHASIRAEEAVKTRTEQVQRLREESQAEFEASDVESLDALIAAQGAEVERLWSQVDQLLDADPAS